jgi:hypothetical protein
VRTFLLILFCLGAYSSANVTVKRRKRLRTAFAGHPAEFICVVIALTSVAVLSRSFSYGFAVGSIATMAIAGVVVAFPTNNQAGRATAGTREFEELPSSGLGINAWKRWLSFSRAVVDYEFRLFLVGCYFVLVGPFALLFRASRPSHQECDNNASSWAVRTHQSTLESARRPF